MSWLSFCLRKPWPPSLRFFQMSETPMISKFVALYESRKEGGLAERHASAMGMKANQLPEISLNTLVEKVSTEAATGGDTLTKAHVRNWMDCVRSRQQPNAPVEAGYNHSIAVIMSNAAYRTGQKVTFNEKTQEVMAGDKVFKY